MKIVNEEPVFDSPIPGEGMTIKLGSRPWQSPAKLKDIDEVMNHYFNAMSTYDFNYKLIDLLESGVSVFTIADTIQAYNSLEGLHSIDLGVLAGPIIAEYIRFVAEANEIEYDMGGKDITEEDPEIMASAILRELEKEQSTGIEEESEAEEEQTNEDAVTGLMSRRSE